MKNENKGKLTSTRGIRNNNPLNINQRAAHGHERV